MSTRVEVELDIFSGNPNPAWTLSAEEADFFLKVLTTLPKTQSKGLSTHLGYRGFTVQVIEEAEQKLVHIQTGTVQITIGNKKLYYSDQGQNLERWLLDSGRFSLTLDLFNMVEDKIPK
jgi:hypothetical protein